ncbi:MAG TPA: DUF6056 family protein [Kofleriaceae bacterium]|nr:DUF6056 family protein [Kofleriaceae bacterium]
MRRWIPWGLFVAYAMATALHLGFVMAHEPFSFDAWNVAVDTKAEPITVSRFFEYWQGQYAHSNPRLGQPLTYLAYKVDGFAEIATPLAYLALTLAVTVLALGRWPRRGRELALWAIAIGFGWFAFPELGRNMFCRSYGANYIYGAAIQLWFLAWLRVGVVEPGRATTVQCVEYGLFGAIAGMCNEHTGPAIVVFLAGYAWWLAREGERPRFALAGAIGVLLGFAALFFAPGQAERYNGLAQRASVVERVLGRGVRGNLEILADYLAYAAPLLAVIVVVLLVTVATSEPDRRSAQVRALRVSAFALAGGLVVVATLGASPKLGSRFFIAPIAVLVAGLLALLDATVTKPRRLAPFVALAVAASAYAAHRTIPLFAQVAAQSEARMAALATSTPGTTFVVDSLAQGSESWWFIGDDLRSADKRALVARYFGLERVVLRAHDANAPLGTLGVRVVPRYRIAGATADVVDDAFDRGALRGTDLAAMQREARAAIDRVRARIAPATLDLYELAVEFDGAIPPLPRRSLVVARWRADRFEGVAARVTHRGRAGRRTVELPRDLTRSAYAIYLARVGRDVRPLGALHYAPWRWGTSWVLACDATSCLVIAAGR